MLISLYLNCIIRRICPFKAKSLSIFDNILKPFMDISQKFTKSIEIVHYLQRKCERFKYFCSIYFDYCALNDNVSSSYLWSDEKCSETNSTRSLAMWCMCECVNVSCTRKALLKQFGWNSILDATNLTFKLYTRGDSICLIRGTVCTKYELNS